MSHRSDSSSEAHSSCCHRSNASSKALDISDTILSKALDISRATAQVAPDLLKALAILSDTTVRRSAVDQEDLQIRNQKNNHISLGEQQSFYLQVFQRPN